MTAVHARGVPPGARVPFEREGEAVERNGAASPWATAAESLVCVPIGLVAPYGFDGVYSGETKSFALGIVGVGDAPYELTATGLPPFARLEGTTVIVTAPVVTSVRVYQVDLVLTARGFTYARRSVPLYVRP